MYTGRLGSTDSRLGYLIPGAAELPGGAWTEPARGNKWTEVARMPSWAELARSNKWSAPTMATLSKRAGETRLYTMDLSNLPEIVGGDTIASVTTILCTGVVGTGGSTSDLTLSSKAVTSSNKGGQCKIAGGVDGCTYQLSFALLSTAGYTLVGIGYLLVEDR